MSIFFPGFPQSHQAITQVVPRLRQDRFRLDIFRYITPQLPPPQAPHRLT